MAFEKLDEAAQNAADTTFEVDGMTYDMLDLERFNTAYRAGNPEIPNEEYDKIHRTALDLFPDHPFFQRREPEPVDSLGSGVVKHAQPMLSIDKAWNQQDLARWVKRVDEAALALGIDSWRVQFYVQPKLDGQAASWYEGVLASAGDGDYGQNITHLLAAGVKTLNYVPGVGEAFTLEEFDLGVDRPVVGEIVCSEEYFKTFLDWEKIGDQGYKHPRNFVVGLIKAVCSGSELRPLAQKALQDGAVHFVPFDNLTTVQFSRTALLDEDGRRDALARLKDQCPYRTDGFVISVAHHSLRAEMGSTNAYHRWNLALKANTEKKAVKVLDVVPQTGRTGQVTPVIKIEPTVLSGCVVSSITAHHYGIIRDRRVGPDAVIEACRSGEVIPYFEQTLESAEPKIPDVCPDCGSLLEWDNDYLFCTGGTACPAQTVRRLQHFFHTMGNVDLFGPATLERLAEAGYTSLGDIYGRLTVSELERLGFGPQDAENRMREIARSMNDPVDDWRFVAALGVPEVGEGTARRLLQKFPIGDLSALTEADLLSVPDVGPVTAASFLKHWPQVQEWFESCWRSFNLRLSQQGPVDSPIAGKTVVFTGSLESAGRKELESQATAMGAKPSSSVSKSTDLVVYGPGAGSKLTKAQELGVRTLTEEEYLKLIAD